MDFWEWIIFLLFFAGFLSPVALVIWEVLWGQRRSVASGRRGLRVLTRRTLRYRLKGIFYFVSATCLLLAIWTSFPLPIAVILTVGVLVGGPLTFLVVSDLRRKRSLARERFANLPSRPLTPDGVPKCELDSEVANSADRSTPTGKRHLPSRGNEPKWWARRWPQMRLGRFGIWH